MILFTHFLRPQVRFSPRLDNGATQSLGALVRYRFFGDIPGLTSATEEMWVLIVLSVNPGGTYAAVGTGQDILRYPL